MTNEMRISFRGSKLFIINAENLMPRANFCRHIIYLRTASYTCALSPLSGLSVLRDAILLLIAVTLLLILVSTSSASSAASSKFDEKVQALIALRYLDAQVATVSYRLAVKNVALCDERQSVPGFVVHDISQYDDDFQLAAEHVFGLSRGPQVLGIARDSPADRAGLRSGDILLGANGRNFDSSGDTAFNTADHIARIETALEPTQSDGTLMLTIERSGGVKHFEFRLEQGCQSGFHLNPSSDLNARADGRNVVISSSLAALLDAEDELAAALAHELAHNILRHRARLAEMQVTNEGRGPYAKQVRQTELEADRFSVRLLETAGYDPEAAVRLWRRLGPMKQRLFSNSQHPAWRERIRAIQNEIERLKTDQDPNDQSVSNTG